MRIVGGAHRGVSLSCPKGTLTRPTSDRVRESLFNILSHNFETLNWDELRVLDLFAGTGALGLEAISRGASFCIFVEQSADVRGIIRENVEKLNLTGRTRIFRRDATKLGDSGTSGKFDLIFSDPPYGKSLGEKSMIEALQGGWLSENAVFVLEEASRSEIDIPDGFRLVDQREYGDTTLYFFELEAF